MSSLWAWVALFAAALLFFRVSVFIHELTHRRRTEIPGFHPAWNLFVGVPLLLPSTTYEGPHRDHHSKRTYGTPNDPEYLPISGPPHLAWQLFRLSFIGPVLMVLRFLVLAPLSWAVPPLRRLLLSRLSTFGFNFAYRRKMTAGERRAMLRWEIITLAVWWTVLAMTFAGWLPARWMTLWFVMIVMIALINHVRELAAHRYESEGRPISHLDQLRDSINISGGCWTELWAPLGLRYHALHHLFPALPFHNMAEAHRRLTDNLPKHAVYQRALDPSLPHRLAQIICDR